MKLPRGTLLINKRSGLTWYILSRTLFKVIACKERSNHYYNRIGTVVRFDEDFFRNSNERDWIIRFGFKEYYHKVT